MNIECSSCRSGVNKGTTGMACALGSGYSAQCKSAMAHHKLVHLPISARAVVIFTGQSQLKQRENSNLIPCIPSSK